MGRRYYCDYCDKTFIDEIEARKKHLQSSHHIKLRNLHYENARGPEVILREELLKTTCRRFTQNGICPFEGNCKYSHYTPAQLCEIRQEVEHIQMMRDKQKEVPDIPTVESWLEKYNEKTSGRNEDLVHIFWSYPENLMHRHDLPPSLVKLRPEHFYDDSFEEWGK